MDKNELEHAEPAEPTSNNAIEQMVLDEEDSPPSGTFQMLASQWVWQCTKSVSIPAEEQNAGRAVDYFYRMEFHITPRFFSDSNYLFFPHFISTYLCPFQNSPPPPPPPPPTPLTEELITPRRRKSVADLEAEQEVQYPEDILPPEDVENASADTLTKELFKRYDKDRDGKLNRMEYGLFLKHISTDEEKSIAETYKKRITVEEFKVRLTPSRVSAIRRLLLAPPIGSIATVDGVEGRSNGKRGRIRAVRRDGLVEVSMAGGTREVVDRENLIWDDEIL